MRQVLCKCETPQLKLTTSAKFWCLQLALRTKIREVITHLRSPKKSGPRSPYIGVKLKKQFQSGVVFRKLVMRQWRILKVQKPVRVFSYKKLWCGIIKGQNLKWVVFSYFPIFLSCHNFSNFLFFFKWWSDSRPHPLNLEPLLYLTYPIPKVPKREKVTRQKWW
jgi:hypothetical protein